MSSTEKEPSPNLIVVKTAEVPPYSNPTQSSPAPPSTMDSSHLEEGTGRGSNISAYFKKWVPPAEESTQPLTGAVQGYVRPAQTNPWQDSSSASWSSTESSEWKPSRGRGAGPMRYFNSQGRIRPGLGVNVDELMAEQKLERSNKKRKNKSGGMAHGGIKLYETKIDNDLRINMAGKRIKLTPEKPAISYLHEASTHLVHAIQYSFGEETRENEKLPFFTCTVVYPPGPDAEGVEFIGEGRSKKSAKNDVALKILRFMGVICEGVIESEELSPKSATKMEMEQNDVKPFPLPTPAATPPSPILPFHYRVPHMGQMEIDFSSDDVINQDFSSGNLHYTAALSQPMVDAALLSRLRNIPNFEENICLVLHTLVFPNPVSYAIIKDEGPAHEKTFEMEVTFNAQSFVGEGQSKKKAKATAAKQAVISLLGIDCYHNLVNQSAQITSGQQQQGMPLTINNQQQPGQEGQGKKKKKSKRKKSSDSNGSPLVEFNKLKDNDEDDNDDDTWGEYDLNISNHFRNLVREKYEELITKQANYSSYKVLAGVVMTTSSPMIYNSKVVAVTTGTKCIEGDCMSPDGLAINDCHAEILATRCLRDFLYSEIELLETCKSEEKANECIVQLNTDPSTEQQQKYKLKDDVRFHLYISTSPCGDARIFSPKGLELEEDDPSASPQDVEDNHPNKINRGVLRSKIEAGEGTIPSANLYAGPQTWDSIVSGNALYTMSCSDKVCRWNVLGFQGALLYNFIGSVFYSSITLGSLHHPIHFKRAVYGRVEPLNSRLDIPFCVNKPKLMMVSRSEKRVVKKSPNHALCWSVNWSTEEILAASKGRCEPGGVASRLAKRMAFSRFLKLYNNVSGRRENYADVTYHEAKQVSEAYQKAKNEFLTFFKESKLGPWIGKPMEQDSFKIK